MSGGTLSTCFISSLMFSNMPISCWTKPHMHLNNYNITEAATSHLISVKKIYNQKQKTSCDDDLLCSIQTHKQHQIVDMPFLALTKCDNFTQSAKMHHWVHVKTHSKHKTIKTRSAAPPTCQKKTVLYNDHNIIVWYCIKKYLLNKWALRQSTQPKRKKK